jgi:hypothetical protein
MKKLIYFLLLSASVVMLSGCSSETNEPEEQNYVSTTVRASAYFSEVGSTEQLNTIYVGRTYSVNFSPFCNADTETLKLINGSVEEVAYFLDTPYVGNECIGVSTTQPFTIQYTPQKPGQCKLITTFTISPNDHNQWVEVESIVEVINPE